MQKPAAFKYSPSDYIFNASGHVSANSTVHLSEFDILLRTKWDEAMSKGYFRYDLGHLQTRIVPGKQNYILQLNWQRLKERRTPENIVSLQTPFDPEKFNFTLVKPDEIMFVMEREGSNNDLTNGFAGKRKSEDEYANHDKKGRHLMLINVSPLEYGHSLLVPDVDCGVPQRLTQTGISLAVDLMLLSAHPGCRVGFNSLCALASVNHQHIHIWYLNWPMAVENVPVKRISDDFYELVDFPARGFAFQLHGASVEEFCGILFRVANFLQTNDVAHNFFMTHGSVFNSVADKESTIRAFFWPRKSFAGVKSSSIVPFNVAVAELAGHVPMYVPEMFEKLTEEYISDKLAEVMLPEDKFNSIRDKINDMLAANKPFLSQTWTEVSKNI